MYEVEKQKKFFRLRPYMWLRYSGNNKTILFVLNQDPKDPPDKDAPYEVLIFSHGYYRRTFFPAVFYDDSWTPMEDDI